MDIRTCLRGSLIGPHGRTCHVPWSPRRCLWRLVMGLLVHSPALLQSVSEKLEKKRGLVTFIVSRATDGQLRPAPQAVHGAPNPFQMINSENN